MDFIQNQSIYLQIAEYIMEKILSGSWKEEDRIPSVRDMAVSIQVNPNTVMRSYTYLQDMGILSNQRGIGYFIGKEAFNETLRLKKETFVRGGLPQFFKTIELLGMSIDEVENLYREYKKGEIK
jgi:GntR family transcriptional regulator